MIKTLYELGLTEDDFNFEIIEITPYTDNQTYSTYMKLISEVNGVRCNISTKLSREFVEDLRSFHIIDAEKEVEKIMKTEAINWYINNNQFVRKMKLTKIKERYGV
jgi:hypothetical protein